MAKKNKRKYKLPGEYSQETNSEEAHQKDVCCWARQTAFRNKDNPQLSKLKFLSGSANGMSTHVAVRMKMVEAGMNKGFPDLHLPVVNKIVIPSPDDSIAPDIAILKHSSLYIEMKLAKRRNHKNGGLDDEQVVWRDFLISEGHAYSLCYSWEEARDVLLAYVTQTGIYKC